MYVGTTKGTIVTGNSYDVYYNGNYKNVNALISAISSNGTDVGGGTYGYGYSDQSHNTHNTTSVVASGVNSHVLSSSIQNQWALVYLHNSNLSYDKTISDFKLQFADGKTYNLTNAVSYGYIEPLVISSWSSSQNNYKTTGTYNLISGGSANMYFSAIAVFFKVKNKSALTRVIFTSSGAFNTWNDGVNIYKVNSGYEIAISSW